MPFLECAARANCLAPGAPARSAAARIWHTNVAPGGAVRPIAKAVSAAGGAGAPPGRVESAGRTLEPVLLAELRSAIPPALGSAMRANLEWYRCRGAFFHNDAHYVDVLFGAWCLAGPTRTLSFPRVGHRLPAAPGDLAIFDPFEPHAVLRPEAATYERTDYEDSEPSVFLGFEIELEPAVRSLFGIVEPWPNEVVTLTSRVAVDAETGALAGLRPLSDSPA